MAWFIISGLDAEGREIFTYGIEAATQADAVTAAYWRIPKRKRMRLWSAAKKVEAKLDHW